MEAGRTLVSSEEDGRMGKNRPRFTLRSFTGTWNGRSREKGRDPSLYKYMLRMVTSGDTAPNTDVKKLRHCVDDSPSSPPLTTM